ncbi:hypothetical protein [Halobacillus sp. BBL2006]|uniref:hypothetical protein n=1 Tax=Halobacillus sp. BBL2006 TaxID=1543706 RepID=UPI0005429320|nr:hypothetical protein [Halobacillus sp. BBL2006]KHE70907.1 hypothetical protein LD39_10915 [Halobacillus sp. BBL2006]
MKQEKKTQYLYMTIGNLGILLIGLAAMRSTTILNDRLGYALTFLGFLMVIIYQDFLEEKMGYRKKERYWVKGIFITIFAVLSYFLYL